MIYNNAIQTLAELTAVQAEQFPERRALICQGQTLICQGQPLTCQGQTLTYQQLHQRSQQLAQALLTVGIQPGARVAFLAQD